MDIDHRDVVQMLRDENLTLKARNHDIGGRLIRYQQAFRALNLMDDTVRGLSAVFDLQKLINRLLSLALHACDSENGSIILVDDIARELVFAEVIGEARDQLMDHRIGIDVGIVGQVVKTGEAALVVDVRKSAPWSSAVDQAIGFKTHALMCAPLCRDADIYGVIEIVNNRSGEDFDDKDLAILKVTAFFVSQALHKAEKLTLL